MSAARAGGRASARGSAPRGGGRGGAPPPPASFLRRGLRRLVRLLFAAVALTALAVLALRWLDPPGGAVIVGRRLSAVFSSEVEAPRRGRWLPLEEISPQLALAVVAAEDQRFFVHHGFDLDAIAEAWKHNRAGGRLRGGSSISQQTAKNLFLWNDRSWLRKGLEAGLTVFVELAWSKERVLEVYLNLAEFGPGVFGADAAARELLHADPAKLTRAQAARLAAALPSPKARDPRKRGASQDGRTRRIEVRMGQLERLGPPAWPLR